MGRVRIPRINKGDPILATLLNSYGTNINDLNKEVFDSPKETEGPQDADALNDAAEEDPEVPITDPSEYIETERSTSTVTVYDDEFTNYAEIERIESITFTNSLGEKIKLVFSGNPTPPTPP